jgi:hypothetical protein
LATDGLAIVGIGDGRVPCSARLGAVREGKVVVLSAIGPVTRVAAAAAMRSRTRSIWA